MKLTTGELSKLVSGHLIGDETLVIHSLSTLEHATSADLSFWVGIKYQKQFKQSSAGCILVPLDFENTTNKTLIKVENPYSAFVLLLTEFQRAAAIRYTGIEQPCFIHESAEIGSECYVGAFSYIGQNVKISDRTLLFPQIYIGENVVIGSNTVIFPGAKIYPGCVIGSYCTVHAGAVIGSFGFGYLPHPDGSHHHIPQIGNAILEDHVDIGANTTIDCATVDSTIIRKGTKIDNLVHIGHNVEVGAHSVIAAQTGISGSTKIGSHVTFAGQVGVAGHIEVADYTRAGGKTGITKSVTKKGKTLSGTFAFDHQQNLKAYTLYKMLPETMDRIRALEEKLLNLKD